MPERAEKPKTGDPISLPPGNVCWGLQMPTDLGVDPAGHFGPEICYAWLIRED